MVTGSTTSFLLMAEPGFSASRTTWVIPALKPMKAVKWIGFDGFYKHSKNGSIESVLTVIYSRRSRNGFLIKWKKLAWEASSFGNDFGVPLGRVQRFLGKNFNDPCRGAENLRWDMTVKLVRTRSKKSKNKSIVVEKKWFTISNCNYFRELSGIYRSSRSGSFIGALSVSLPICVFIGFLHFLSLTIHHRYRYSLSFCYSRYYSP